MIHFCDKNSNRKKLKRKTHIDIHRKYLNNTYATI